jgi:hypothetical protein
MKFEEVMQTLEASTASVLILAALAISRECPSCARRGGRR